MLVRVIDHGRVGSHRTGAIEPGDLDNAVRAAVAQSRARDPLPGLPHLPADDGPLPRLERLSDPAVSRLDADGLAAWARGLRRRGENLRLRWADARVAVFSSRGLRRGASATAIELAVRAGAGPGGGLAVEAARSLAALGAEAVFERARERRSQDAIGGAPAEPTAAVLSPEATAALVELLNHEAFSAAAYYDGSSPLREHLGVQVFDRALNLRDDATDPAGLPFPFDLEGTPKRRVELIEQGTPRTPALDQRQAAVLGLQPTGARHRRRRRPRREPLPGARRARRRRAARASPTAASGSAARRPRVLRAPPAADPGACSAACAGSATAGWPSRCRTWSGRPACCGPWPASPASAPRPSRSLGRSGYLGGISTPALAIRAPEIS